MNIKIFTCAFILLTLACARAEHLSLRERVSAIKDKDSASQTFREAYDYYLSNSQLQWLGIECVRLSLLKEDIAMARWLAFDVLTSSGSDYLWVSEALAALFKENKLEVDAERLLSLGKSIARWLESESRKPPSEPTSQPSV